MDIELCNLTSAIRWLLPAVVLAVTAGSPSCDRSVTAPEGTGIVVTGPGLSGAMRAQISREATSALAYVSRRLERKLQKPVEIDVYERLAEVPAAVRKSFRDWTVAVASTHQYRVTVVSRRLRVDPPDNLKSVLLHELTHIVLGDLELSLSGGKRTLPLWFHEGLAQEIAGSVYLSGQEEIVAVRLITGEIYSWGQLAQRFPPGESDSRAAYAQCASFFSFLMEEVGLGLVMKSAENYLTGRAESLDAGMALESNTSFGKLTGPWEKRVREGRGLLSLLGRSCFEILLLLCVPLLILVMRRRNARERQVGELLDEFERYDYGEVDER